MDQEALVVSPMIADPVVLPGANIPNTHDALNVPAAVEADGSTKKSNKKKNKERAERARLAKSAEPDDVNYNDVCRQLASMQKELNIMKTKVGFSRPKTVKNQCDGTSALHSTNAV